MPLTTLKTAMEATMAIAFAVPNGRNRSAAHASSGTGAYRSIGTRGPSYTRNTYDARRTIPPHTRANSLKRAPACL
jgi:hypothetical protein